MGIYHPFQYDNIEAVTSPTITDDETSGYRIGSRWYNTVTDEWFICGNATTGNAQWSFQNRGLEAPAIKNELNRFIYTEHFIQLAGSILPVSNSITGSAPAPQVQQAEGGHPGVRRLRTGNTAVLSRSQDSLTGGTTAITLRDGITDLVFSMKPREAALTALDGYQVLIGINTAVGMPAAKGIYFYYDNVLYGDNFFRVVFINGASTYTVVTPFALDTLVYWRLFGIRCVAGNYASVGNRYFEFWYGDEHPTTPIAYQIANTVTEGTLTTVGFPLPFNTSDIYTPSWGIQKAATSVVQRTLDVDALVFGKLL